VVTELEALWTLDARVRDLASSLSTAAELLEGRVDAASTNRVHWGTLSVLVAELELLGSWRNAALTEDQVDALWALACPASDLLPCHVRPSFARAPLMMQRSSSGGSLHHCSFAFV
jgi:hypothetical protein